MKLLNEVQSKFEESIKKRAKTIYNFKTGVMPNFEYSDVFNLDDDIKKKVFEEVPSFDMASLDKNGLINFGITNEHDLDFFLKLRDIKLKLLEFDSKENLSTIKLKDSKQLFYGEAFEEGVILP